MTGPHDAGEPDPAGADPADAVARGVEALQSAAQEMITAARAMLDVADELVRDPDTAGAVFGAITSVARAARGFTVAPGRSGDDEPDDDGVQRIPVS